VGRVWIKIWFGLALIGWVACQSSSSRVVHAGGSKSEAAKAYKKLQDLNATQIDVTGKLIGVRDKLLSMPKDSPPTRELTRQLAILNKRATELASEVFRAGLEYQAAVQVDQETKMSQVNANSPSSLVIEQGGLRLYTFSVQSDEDSGTRSVVGELENGGTNMVVDVTLVFDLYDAKNQVVGAVTDFTPSVQAGSRWSYQALILDEAAVRAEFKSLDWGGEDQGKLPQLPGVKPEPARP
jgi:hypothetical protein